jgi:hypothetical protein
VKADRYYIVVASRAVNSIAIVLVAMIPYARYSVFVAS